MKKVWVPTVLLGVAGAIVSAQTLVEHATAAAGGTAAAAAGKKVSDGIDSVFGALANVAKDATGKDEKGKTKARRTLDPAPPIPEVRVMPMAAPAGPAKKPAAPAVAKRVPAGPASVPAVAPVEPAVPVVEAAALPPAPPAPPEPTAEDLASLNAGASRADVTAKMGRPSSRVTMDDDGKLVEIYSYRTKAGSLGSVRLVDGVVKDVRPAR